MQSDSAQGVAAPGPSPRRTNSVATLASLAPLRACLLPPGSSAPLVPGLLLGAPGPEPEGADAYDDSGSFADDDFEAQGEEDANSASHSRGCASLDVAIESGVVEPLLQQCMLVELTLTRVLKSHGGLRQRLEEMRGLLLMGQGDLFGGVVQRMCELFDARVELSPRVLRVLVAHEAEHIGMDPPAHFWYALASQHEVAERLREEAAEEGAAQVLGAPEEDAGRPYAAFERLTFLRVEYRLEWPLSVVVRESELRAYRRVHRFLLGVKFAYALAKGVWKRLVALRGGSRSGSRGGSRSEPALGDRLAGWLDARWHRLRQLLRALETYALNELLDDKWERMSEALTRPNANHLAPAHLQRLHAQFAQAALMGCFLDGSRASKVLQAAIRRVLRCAVLFHEATGAMLEAREAAARGEEAAAGATAALADKLRAQWDRLEATQRFLVKTVKGLASRPDAPAGAAALLMHVNFNSFFY